MWPWSDVYQATLAAMYLDPLWRSGVLLSLQHPIPHKPRTTACAAAINGMYRAGLKILQHMLRYEAVQYCVIEVYILMK